MADSRQAFPGRTGRFLNRLTRKHRLVCAVAALLLVVAPAEARRHMPESWARQHYATAEKLREALNGRPAEDRSRRGYQRVIDAYRHVYYGSPASAKADPSVVAVAELLVEMGRQFDDAKVLKSAIGQYQFLRREYPGSRYRFDALFTIGEIYKEDLEDPAKARETFQEFVHRYPHNRLAEQAKKELSEPVQEAADKKPVSNSAQKNSKPTVKAKPEEDDSDQTPSGPVVVAKPAAKPSGRLARVTGIRHWSTPDYTRVAIDLEQDVKFESQRIDGPDRIFFDLRGTILASTLVGKSFDVDDGFLKKIRVAQFKNDQTRVVLEVDSLSQYDAFLLPNPYRLIVDIHGKDAHGKDASGKTVTKVKEPVLKDAAGDASDVPPPTPAVAMPDKELPNPTEPADSGAQAEHGKPETASVVKLDKSAATKAKSAAPKKSDETDDSDDADDSVTDTAKTDTGKADAAKADAVKAGSGKTKDSGLVAKDTVVVKDKIAKISDASEPGKSAKAGKTTRSAKDSSKNSDGKNQKAQDQDEEDVIAHEARPTANGDRSLIRALGLKIGKIVIDAGHGGHDTGTIGPNGVREKDVVLDVSRKLGKMLQQRLGAEVVYTRSDDTFIPLETRTAIANRERADLFVSIHANSSDDPDARGVETYYLNFTSSRDALEVAARENAVSEKSIHELQDLVKKIALKEKIEESREFASDVQTSLYSSLAARNSNMRNRGVKKAPFIVLIGANMPSILAEISFVSNPEDARKLQTQERRQQIADSLYRGIARYVNGLSGVKVASKISREERSN